MRAPSVKNLTTSLHLSTEQANLIRALAKATDDAEELEALVAVKCPKTEAYVRKLHSSPWNSHMWRVTVALHAMDEIVGTYGVESLGPVTMSGPPYEYLNTGDTYNTTLIYNRKTDALSIGAWGDIAEKHPSW